MTSKEGGRKEPMQQERFSIAKSMLHQLLSSTDAAKQAKGLSDRDLSQLAKD